MSKNSFEISLVPEVKAKLLHQERVRNLVVFACILVAIGCGVIVAGLILWSGSLKLKLNGMDNEIACRIGSELKGGKKSCGSVKSLGTPILETANLNEMLSIQNELNSIGDINKNKTKPSRLLPTTEQLETETKDSQVAFSMFEIALPTDADYQFKTSEFKVDFESSVMNYDVVAHAVNNQAQ